MTTPPTIETLWDNIQEAAAFLRTGSFAAPKIGLVLGSGLGGFAEHIKVTKRVPYRDIPHFASTHIAGHKGELLFGEIGGVPTAIFNGRVHAYEGHSMQTATFNMRVLHALGAKGVILTNAAGGINPTFSPGDLMVIADHINMQGDNPLRGPNDERLGVRFVDMSAAYDVALRKLWHACAHSQKLSLREGIYVSVLGPNYETPAEIRCFGRMGADAVGMSTVPETIVARHLGLKVAGLSVVTNLAAGLSPVPLSHAEVTATGQSVQQQLFLLLTVYIPRAAALIDAQPS